MLTMAAESLYDGPAVLVSLGDVPYGADFTVEAEPAEGWRLREWLGNGDFSGSDPVLEGTVDRNLSGTAVFARRHTLSIEVAPASEVAVDVYGPALLAPDSVTVLDAVEGRELHEYVVDRETVLFLDPHPASPGWRFMAWSGTDAASVSGNELEMDGDKSIEAVFARDWALVLGENITADPEPDGNGRYLDGAEVTLTAVPPEGYQFTGWTGDLSGTANPETLEMDANKSVGAVFTPDTHTLTVSCDTSQGSVAVYLNGSGTPATGSGGVYAVHFGDAVRLEASPMVDDDMRHLFTGWTGVPVEEPEDALNPEVTFSVTGDVSVSATFQRQYWVELSVSGEGDALLMRYNESVPPIELCRQAGDGTSDPVWVDAGAELRVFASVGKDAGSYLNDWELDDISQGANPPELALGVAGLDKSTKVKAVFGREHTFTLEVYPATIGGLSDPPPGTVEISCTEPGSASCVNFTVRAGATQPYWRFKRWSQWVGNEWVPVGYHFAREITLGGDMDLRAEFEWFYLPDDLQALINYVGLNQYYNTTQLAFSESCGGHVMPDVVGMALVDLILNRPAITGDAAEAVRSAYWDNMDKLHDQFDILSECGNYQRPDSAVISAMAGAAVYSNISYQVFFFMVWLKERSRKCTTVGFPMPELSTVSALAPCADLDGDGFSNVEEWLYFDFLTHGELAGLGNWTGTSPFLLRMALLFAAWQPGLPEEVPDFTGYVGLEAYEKIIEQTVTVTIAREGDGGAVYPSPGTYVLPKYHLTDWWTRNSAGNYVPRECADCAPIELVVVAKPQGDYVLAKWRGVGVISGDPTEREKAPGVPRNPVYLSLEWPHNISAVFKARPGVGDLDLLSDVAAFYLATNVCTMEQFYGNVVDFGGTGDTEYPTGLGEAFDDYLLALGIGRRFTGNGIPDAVEVALLQAVLDNPAQRTTIRGEASFSMTWDEFSDNLAQARTDFPFLTQDVQRGVAALTCLGNYGHAALISALAQGLYSINVVPADYATTCREHLAPGGDADGDGVTNLAEWHMVEDASHEGENETDAAALRCEYVKFAMTEDGGALLNPNQGDDYDNDPDPDQNNETTCGCWNDNCEPNVSLGIFKGYSHSKFGEIPASCRVIYENKESSSQRTHTTSGPEGAQPDPKECDTNKEHAADKIISVQSGLTVKVKADESDGFEYWYAPGTPIHGSKEAKETFSMPGGGVTIQPRENLHYIAIDGKGYEVECTPGKDSEYVRLFYTPTGVLWQIAAREGATVTLSLKNGYTAEWLAINDGVGGNRICETIGNSVTIAFFNYLFMDMPDKIEVGMVYPIPGFVGPPMDGAMSEGGVAVVGFGSRVATGFLYANAYRMPGTNCSGCGASPDWRIIPFKGYELIDYYVNISTRPCSYWHNGLVITCTEYVSGCVEGEFKKMPTLTVKQKIVECNSEGKKNWESPSCAGYVFTDPAVKYHTRGSYVTVMAVPRAGFIFMGWEGIPKGYGTGLNLMTRDFDNPYDFENQNTVTDNPISFPINDDLEVTALYTRPYGCDRYIMPDF